MRGVRPARRPGSAETGLALVVCTLAMSLMVALGTALALVTMAETTIAGAFRARAAALHGADAAVELTLRELARIEDWNLVLGGVVRSALADGPGAGERQTAAGRVDLAEMTNRVLCGKPAYCTEEEMSASTPERPWGRNNPRWQLFASFHLRDVTGTTAADSSVYVVVWVADDPAECDGDPLRDGGLPVEPCAVNAGAGVISILAHALAPGGVRRVVEASTRKHAAGVTLLSWRDVR